MVANRDFFESAGPRQGNRNRKNHEKDCYWFLASSFRRKGCPGHAKGVKNHDIKVLELVLVKIDESSS